MRIAVVSEMRRLKGGVGLGPRQVVRVMVRVEEGCSVTCDGD